MTGIVKVDEIQNNAGTTTLAKIENGQLTGVLSPATGFRNRIINGDMRIDQRNNGASVTPSASATYTIDRFLTNFTQATKFSVQQNAGSVTPPNGFKNYLGVTSLAATSVGAGDFFAVQHIIEGFNISDFGFGTANAQDITLSFNVQSSLTGTFGGCVTNGAHNRSYPFTFNVSTANAFERKTVTIEGDTAGTWATDNNAGMRIWFGLGAGSTFSGTADAWAGSTLISATGATSVVGTNGATFFITGVQLEKGTVATPFEFRSIGQELALCQRYFQVGDVHLLAANTSSGDGTVSLPVQMRANPGYTFTDSLGATDRYTDSAGSGLTIAINANNVNTYRFRVQVALARAAVWWEFNYRLSAEL